MPKTTEEGPRRWRRALGVLALLLLLGGLLRAAFGGGHLARAQALQAELSGDAGKALPPEERKAKFDALRAEMKQFSEQDKAAFFAPVREKMNADLDRYFAMTPRDKTKHLDEIIDRSEKSRKDREARAKAGGGPGAAAGGPLPGGRGGGPPGGFGFGGGPPGGGSKGPPNPDDVEARKKKMLDHSTPEERAKRDQFRKDLEARRKQRGLPPSPGRGV